MRRRRRSHSTRGGVVGIIGAGRMGGWFTWFLTRRGSRVVLFDTDSERAQGLGERVGVRVAGSLEELARSVGVIMIAVPPWEVSGVLVDLAPHVREGSLVFDIATFKTHVVEGYKRLPGKVDAASAHPLFGPGAPLSNPGAFKVITMPVREGRGEERLRRFFSDLGFKVESMGWEEHDRVMALTIGVSFALGAAIDRVLLEKGLENLLEKSGSSFKALAIHALSLLNQDERLVEYVLSLPVVREAVEHFIRIIRETVSNPQETMRTLKRAREEFGIEWLDAAYVSLYRAIETFTLD